MKTQDQHQNLHGKVASTLTFSITKRIHAKIIQNAELFGYHA